MPRSGLLAGLLVWGLLGIFFFLPLVSGLVMIILSGLGWDIYQSSNGSWEVNMEAYQHALTYPQFLPSLWLTLRTGLISAILSLGLTYIILGGWVIRPKKWMSRLLAVWLSYPHVALAIGLVFLIAPSGILIRIVGAPFSLESPPLWETYQDSFGFSLIVGLTLKETVFLLFMAFSRLSQINVIEQMTVSKSLGYSPGTAWLKIIWPQVYRGIRFPFFIALSYSLSAIDMSIILAGETPPPLAILILNWFNDPNLSYTRMSSAASILLITVFGGAVILWKIVEQLSRLTLHRLIIQGSRKIFYEVETFLSSFFFGGITAVMALSLLVNATWSFARSWPFPALSPIKYTLDTWAYLEKSEVQTILTHTVLLAAISAGAAMILTVMVLELRLFKDSFSKLINRRLTRILIFLPLLLPSISFFLGIRTFFLVGFSTPYPWLFTATGHFLMVFPYVILNLEKTYLSYNQKYFSAAQTLSGNNFKAFFRVKVPMLKKPLLSALAIGLSVSVMDYLATVILSGGRIATLTTEAVQLSEGGSHRVMGFFAILQTFFLLIIFFLCQNFTPAKYPNMR